MEMMYQYLWRYRMLGRKLRTVDGRTVKVLRPGTLNRDAGPDFLDARISIDSQEWAGNVEIHVRASDWHKHGHDTDPAYNNVILHVVAVNDCKITLPDGRELPQTLVVFPPSFFSLYASLSSKLGRIPCEQRLPDLSPLTVSDWTETLCVERMQAKADRALQICKALNGDWEQTAFAMLARALGFGLNSQPFEMLGRSIPLKYLWHHADNPLQVEALLFGQAGMLDMSVNIFNEYFQTLCREYFFLARKYSLRPIPASQWKYARTRPMNFPHRRIAMLTVQACSQKPLMASLLEAAKDVDKIREILDWPLSGYWEKHLDFTSEPSLHAAWSLSEASRNLLLINFAAPLLYAYGASISDPELAGKGLDIWEELPPENNTYIRQWNTAGIPSRCASHSQALLQLRKEYCDRDRCLECRFGLAMLRTEASLHS